MTRYENEESSKIDFYLHDANKSIEGWRKSRKVNESERSAETDFYFMILLKVLKSEEGVGR